MFKCDQGVTTLSDIIALIKSELKEFTKKFDFLIVEEFESIVRQVKRNALVIPRISKLHSLTLVNDAVIAKEWSCSECRVSEMCVDCIKLDSISKSQIKIGNDENAENDEENFDNIYDDDDEGRTDESDSDYDSTDDDDEDEIQPGDIVWGLLGRIWYPGRVCDLTELPENLQHKFSNIANKCLIHWYGDNMYSAIKRVERLGETQVDAQRSSRSSDMQKLYNMALSDL